MNHAAMAAAEKKSSGDVIKVYNTEGSATCTALCAALAQARVPELPDTPCAPWLSLHPPSFNTRVVFYRAISIYLLSSPNTRDNQAVRETDAAMQGKSKRRSRCMQGVPTWKD